MEDINKQLKSIFIHILRYPIGEKVKLKSDHIKICSESLLTNECTLIDILTCCNNWCILTKNIFGKYYIYILK